MHTISLNLIQFEQCLSMWNIFSSRNFLSWSIQKSSSYIVLGPFWAVLVAPVDFDVSAFQLDSRLLVEGSAKWYVWGQSHCQAGWNAQRSMKYQLNKQSDISEWHSKWLVVWHAKWYAKWLEVTCRASRIDMQSDMQSDMKNDMLSDLQCDIQSETLSVNQSESTPVLVQKSEAKFW